jgi:hypothetical protein
MYTVNLEYSFYSFPYVAVPQPEMGFGDTFQHLYARIKTSKKNRLTRGEKRVFSRVAS